MKKVILVIAVALMTVAILITPVFAIGPINAVNNPNVQFLMGYPILVLPNGQVTEWRISGDMIVHVQHKPADKYQIKTAITVTINGPQDLAVFYANEGKWVYFTQNSYANFLRFIGANPMVAAKYPEGLYVRSVIIGK